MSKDKEERILRKEYLRKLLKSIYTHVNINSETIDGSVVINFEGRLFSDLSVFTIKKRKNL